MQEILITETIILFQAAIALVAFWAGKNMTAQPADDNAEWLTDLSRQLYHKNNLKIQENSLSLGQDISLSRSCPHYYYQLVSLDEDKGFITY